MTTEDVVVDVSQDWALACNVQQRFMQGLGRSRGSVDSSARCRQLQALGGDCYDFMALGEDRLALAVGDASGKGLAAALMIASVQSSLRTAALFTPNDLAALLKVVNHQAYLVVHEPVRDLILWHRRRSGAYAALRQCRT
jgi:phosphoserine phosphatase RsbU/P